MRNFFKTDILQTEKSKIRLNLMISITSKKIYIMVFRNIQWFMDWWFNCVAIEYGYPGENSTLLSRSPASSEIKTTFVIFSHSKTKFRTMAARIGKYSGCSQRRFRLVFCYWVLKICLKNLYKAKFFRVTIFMVHDEG